MPYCEDGRLEIDNNAAERALASTFAPVSTEKTQLQSQITQKQYHVSTRWRLEGTCGHRIAMMPPALARLDTFELA